MPAVDEVSGIVDYEVYELSSQVQDYILIRNGIPILGLGFVAFPFVEQVSIRICVILFCLITVITCAVMDNRNKRHISHCCSGHCCNRVESPET